MEALVRHVHLLFIASLVLVALAAGCNRRGGVGRGSVPRGTGEGGVMDLDGGVDEEVSPPGRDGGTSMGCGDGTQMCGESCVDIYSDPLHCGGCFAACDGGAYCEGGECIGEKMPTCFEPRVMCDGSCVDLSSNPAHCGECFYACPSGTYCSSYECVSTCTPSCSGRECGSDGCGGSCGTCGSGETCTFDGYCDPACAPGQTLCSGVCRSTLTDPSNCGGCAISCSIGYSCVSGACTPPTTGSGESCTSPSDFPAAGGSRTFTFTGRSANHTPLSCGTSSSTPDVVYRWTPTRSGTATFRAYGPTSSTDVMLSVFSSSSCTSTYSIACNDDETSGVFSSRATATVSAFSTYYVVVAPYSTTADTITLAITSP
jgi:hypothetical protein